MTQKTVNAQRLRRPSWKDPRLIAGILIVLISTAAVVWLVLSQDRTIAVYAADRQLSSGESLSEEDLRVVHVQLEDVAEHYLAAAEDLPEQVQVMRAVMEGELIPKRSLGERDPQSRQQVTVQVDHELARAVEPGRGVDVWAATAESPSAESAVDRLVEAAEVTDIRESSSTFGGQTAVTVELLINPQELPALLGAEGAGAALTVLPAETGQP